MALAAAAGTSQATETTGLSPISRRLGEQGSRLDISRAVEKVVAAQPEADLGELAAAIAEMTGGKR